MGQKNLNILRDAGDGTKDRTTKGNLYKHGYKEECFSVELNESCISLGEGKIQSI